MLAGVNRRRLQELSRSEFVRECRKLSDHWRLIGCPDVDDMPRAMLVRWTALKEEQDRRGHQEMLF